MIKWWIKSLDIQKRKYSPGKNMHRQNIHMEKAITIDFKFKMTMTGTKDKYNSCK